MNHHNPLFPLLFLCVFPITHFDDYGKEIFDNIQTVFSVLVGNILIIDEHNDGTCHFKNDSN